ncbi:hypothetical protein VSS74_03310 [Conexibacter stalactiti]|uniref:Uncharacterized protein n=1 Tax=Conexibacter stalactiti TaxID=1940611 RepID=A0ABU4HJ58_9ACTN|nr:hypothetical protein [Conexibacter stalactiti]MDW5593349.1 hypothetical protein [Conexibacter stalactiti]MEC5033990.1 hypothetical protein [Conexibacter stalactiti]
MRTVRLLRRGALAAALVAAAAPAVASGDSLVYVQNHDIWLARPDGSGQYRVTTDGSAAAPYRSPSQADDGTIAAGHGTEIVRLRQNGEVLSRFDPPALVNSAGDWVDGPPVQVALAPDGARIAWTVVSNSCPVGVSCGIRSATAVTSADGTASPDREAITHLRQPSWATSTRLLQFGGYGSHVNVVDLGGGGPVHWFDDQDTVSGAGTDLGDGELSPDGRRFAAVRGYAESTHLVWYDVSGSALSGAPPAAPAMRCATNEVAGLAGPTWSPAGDALAWAIPEGVLVKRGPDDCGSPQPSVVLPGASQPDWGPADVNPGPRPVTPMPPAPRPAVPVTPPADGGGQQPARRTRPGGGAARLTARLSAASLSRALRSGLVVRVRVPGAGTLKALATTSAGRVTIASGGVRARRAGELPLTLRIGARGRAALRGRRTVRVTVRVTFTPRNGAARATTVATTLRR